jgi:hypothetical protein
VILLTAQEPSVALLAIALAQAGSVHGNEAVVSVALENLEIGLKDGVGRSVRDRLVEGSEDEDQVGEETDQRSGESAVSPISSIDSLVQRRKVADELFEEKLSLAQDDHALSNIVWIRIRYSDR